jgi:hypothetical protein
MGSLPLETLGSKALNSFLHNVLEAPLRLGASDG